MRIQKGEALLIQSSQDFDFRIDFIEQTFPPNSDIVVLKNKSLSIEDVRDFKAEFNKTSHEYNADFKKLGILIFDDISINAQNSLLKILEDTDKENCIMLYTNKNIKLLSTILSRVVLVNEEKKSETKKIQEPNLEDKESIDKQEVIRWIEYTIENSKINRDKTPLIWINSPSPNIKYIVEYVNLFY